MSRILFDHPNRIARSYNLSTAIPIRLSSGARSAFNACRSALLLPLLLVFLAAVTQAQQTTFGLQPVGSASASQSVKVTASAAGKVATVQVLTQGMTGLDFAAGGTSTCTSANLNVASTCAQSVTFTPSAPGLRLGAVVLLDGNGNILGTTFISGTGQGGLGVLVKPVNVIPVAGDGAHLGLNIGDQNPALTAELNEPTGVTFDGAGNMYIADSDHNRIRMVCGGVGPTIKGTVCPSGPTGAGVIYTIAGNGNPAYTGDGQLAASSTVSTPADVALDGAGNLYIADSGNNAVRVVWAATGIITTIAGNNGNQGNTGDGAPATSALLNTPSGVTLDPQGDIFIADTSNHRIRMICAQAPGTVINGTACPEAGDITTVAGNGFTQGNEEGGFSGDNGPATKAELNSPFAVAFDAMENMYIPDRDNNRIRMVNPSGIISTFAGTGQAKMYGGDGGPATDAQIWAPSGVAVDPAGNVYIADSQNLAIRKVSGAASSNPGVISTLAINGAGSFIQPGQEPSPVSINTPIGLYLDGAGDLYFADSINMIVREIQSNASAIDFTMMPVRQGETSPPQNQTVENDGNLPWTPTAITFDQNAAVNTAGTNCEDGTALAVDVQCTVSVEFAPSVNVPPTSFELGNVDVASAAVNQPLDIIVFGNATPVNSTTVAVSSNINPAIVGTQVTFTASVTTGAGTGNLTGQVTFVVDGVAIPGASPVGPSTTQGTTTTATATYFTAIPLSAGTHTITATYADDPTHLPSGPSNVFVQTMIQGTSVALISSSPQNISGEYISAVGAPVTFTATVTAGTASISNGTVTFMDGSTILQTVTLFANGTATYTTSTLTNGLHIITATYNGDPQQQIQPSTSLPVNQDVVQPSTVVLNSTPNPSAFGVAVTFTATITSQSTQPPTGAVNFLDGMQQIGTANVAAGIAVFNTSSLAPGTHSITAVYVGDTYNGAGTSIAVSQVVKQAATATALIAKPNPAIAGGPTVLTATVTVTQGVSTPTGTVTFTSGGAPLGTPTSVVNGVASITVLFTPPGSQSIIATYSGDTNDTGSASAPLLLPVQIATTNSVVSSSVNPSVALSSVTFSVKVTGNGGIPGGTVIFSADGTPIGTETLDATGSASVSDANLAVGSHAITVAYSGDANDAPSTSAVLTQVVGTIPTATALGTSTTGGATPEVILVASVVGTAGPTPTGTVTFQIGNVVLGSAPVNSSGVAILVPNLPAGTDSVVAIYSGDSLHAGSQSPTVSISSVPLDFSISVSPATITIASSQNATLTVALTSYSGFTDTIGLGCASLPAAVNCHFSTINEPLVANLTQTVQLTIDTNNPLGGGTSTASSQRPGAAKALFAGLALPLSLFFGCVFWIFRKRHRAVFTTLSVVLFGLASMAVTACSGFTQVSAAPGTYVIQVTGTGNNSDIVHYQNVTITITK